MAVATVFAASLAAAAPAHAEWLKGETEHFIIIGDTSEGAIRDYARKVERFDGVLRLWFPPRSEIITPKLTIYLADGRADMRKIWPDMPANVGGFYTPGEERTFAVTGGSGAENDHTLFHEYAHHYMHQNMPGAYPGWFVEGFAEFFATADVTPSRMRVGLHSPGRMNSLTMPRNSWLPMETVLRSRSSEIRGRGHFYYAQSWALAHYFLSTDERRAALGRYLTAVMGGGDPVASLQPSTGLTPVQLQDEVATYLHLIRFRPEQRESPPAEVTITRLPASARDLVWLDLRLARFVPEELRAGNLAEAERAAARHPGDPWAARVLAQAHLDMQQNARAVEVMQASVAAHPDDALGLRMQAVAMMDLGDEIEDSDPDRRGDLFRQARQALARAYQIDAMDYRLYIALDRSRQGVAGYPTTNDVETLLMGRALAPQVQGLGVRAAQALMAVGEYRTAAAFLAPIANNPHGGSGLNNVRRLLAEAREKAGLPPLASTADLVAEEAANDGADGRRDGGGDEGA
jgi:tetratricopeptide (TPR) repeat protein